MNVHLTRGNRTGKPFLLSIENKDILSEEQEEFHSQYDSPMVTSYDCVCTQEVFAEVVDIVGTPEAPALIANAEAQPFEGRVNCYIQNGSLKILAQS